MQNNQAYSNQHMQEPYTRLNQKFIQKISYTEKPYAEICTIPVCTNVLLKYE